MIQQNKSLGTRLVKLLGPEVITTGIFHRQCASDCWPKIVRLRKFHLTIFRSISPVWDNAQTWPLSDGTSGSSALPHLSRTRTHTRAHTRNSSAENWERPLKWASSSCFCSLETLWVAADPALRPRTSSQKSKVGHTILSAVDGAHALAHCSISCPSLFYQFPLVSVFPITFSSGRFVWQLFSIHSPPLSFLLISIS